MPSTTGEEQNTATAERPFPGRVVVPLDGSTASARSLAPAAAIAAATGASVSLVSVVMPSFVATVTDRIRGQAAHAGIADPSITLDVSSMAPGDRLLAMLDDSAEVLLCLASTGRSRFGQILGSVSETLLRARRGPFVLIGPECEPDSFSGGGPILLPIDGSAVADSALPLATTWAAKLNRPIEVVTVVDPDDAAAAADHGVRLPNEADIPRRRAEQIAGATWEVLHDASPAKAVVERARDADASMIVMATHGRTGLPRVVLGSVALETVHRSPCPVLLHRPASMRTA